MPGGDPPFVEAGRCAPSGVKRTKAASRAANTAGGAPMCGKERTCRSRFLEVWQGKELWVVSSDLWQRQDLGEERLNSGRRDPSVRRAPSGLASLSDARLAADFADVWQIKELVTGDSCLVTGGRPVRWKWKRGNGNRQGEGERRI